MKKDFIETMLFYKLKDKPIKNKKEFISTLINYNADVDSLYLKINKYQVKRYGTTLYKEKGDTKDERKRPL